MRNVTVERARSPLIAPEWQLIAFLWFCYVLNQADRQVVYTLFPALQKTFGFSNAVLGLTGALFLWVFGVFSPIAGVLGDRFSKTTLVLGSLTVWSFLPFCRGCRQTDRSCWSAERYLEFQNRFSCLQVMRSSRQRMDRARARGRLRFSGPASLVGVAIGGSTSAFIAQKFDWRVSFWLLGGMGILFAIPLSRFFRRMPAEFAEIESGPRADLRSFFVLFKIPTVRIIAFAIAVATFGLFLVYTWLPTFLYDKFQIGLARAGFEASVYPQIGTACGLLVGGWLADRYNPRVKASRFGVIVTALFCGAPCMFLLGWTGRLAEARLAAMAVGFFAGFITGNQAAATFDVVPSRCALPPLAF